MATAGVVETAAGVKAVVEVECLAPAMLMQADFQLQVIAKS
jgi:hypothetical protein